MHWEWVNQTLSEITVYLQYPDFERLEQKGYDNDDNVKEWRQQVEENKKNKTNVIIYKI